jgi:DNA-binding protein H-NS
MRPLCVLYMVGIRFAIWAEHTMSKKLDLDAMSVDDMWQLHEEISRVLSVRLKAEKRELEKRLVQLRHGEEEREGKSAPSKDTRGVRRKYPRVVPKYFNPNKPTETWSGRGKQPRWLTAALKTGHTIEEFAIATRELNNHKRRK